MQSDSSDPVSPSTAAHRIGQHLAREVLAKSSGIRPRALLVPRSWPAAGRLSSPPMADPGLQTAAGRRVLRATRCAVLARRAARPLPTPLQAARTAAWTLLALRRTRSALAGAGQPTTLPTPPKAPSAHPVVLRVLGLGRARCLSRSAVRQAWLAGQGDPRDLIIGVTAPSTGFRAHAWLDGDRDGAGFTELSRSPIPADSSSPSA